MINYSKSESETASTSHLHNRIRLSFYGTFRTSFLQVSGNIQCGNKTAIGE